MTQLDSDVLSLIFEQLDDGNDLFSCLLVNRMWCENIIPILWKNPWRYYKKRKELLSTIISHLPGNQRYNLMRKGVNLFLSKPLLCNYISFCKSLNLKELDRILLYRKMSRFIKAETYDLFINSDNRYTNLLVRRFDYPAQHFAGAEDCFSKLESFCCYTDTNEEFLAWIIGMNIPIKKFKIYANYSNDRRGRRTHFHSYFLNHGFHHGQVVQFHQFHQHQSRIKEVPFQLIESLINNSREHLTEINTEFLSDDTNRRFIQTICQRCPNIKYFKIIVEKDGDLLGLETLLTKCKYLEGLHINCRGVIRLNFENLFDKLVNSAPKNLFKLKLKSYQQIPLEAWKAFFCNWRDRPPMLLQTFATYPSEEYLYLIENYKFLGIIEAYDNCENENTFEDF